MANKTIIVGDLHLGKGLSIGKPAADGGLNSRLSDQVRLLNWIFDCSINRNVNRIIITGDVFDETKPDSNLIVIFMDWLRQCEDYGIDVHIVVGNHDLKRIGNRYTSILNVIGSAGFDRVFIYNSFYTLHTEGVSFTFVPYRDKRALGCNTVEEAILKIGELIPFELGSIPVDNDRVLVGHLALEGSFWTDEIDDVSNELMVPLQMFEGYTFTWMGHVHTPQLMNCGHYVEHIGSLDISDFGETNHKKNIICYDPFTSNRFEKIIIPTRPLRRVKIEIPKCDNATEFLLNYISKQNKSVGFKDALVKIELKLLDPESKDIDRVRIIEELNKLGVYYISYFSESRSVAVVPDDKKHISDSAISPKDAVKSWADMQDFSSNEDEKQQFVNACLEVISATDAG